MDGPAVAESWVLVQPGRRAGWLLQGAEGLDPEAEGSETGSPGQGGLAFSLIGLKFNFPGALGSEWARGTVVG